MLLLLLYIPISRPLLHTISLCNPYDVSLSYSFGTLTPPPLIASPRRHLTMYSFQSIICNLLPDLIINHTKLTRGLNPGWASGNNRLFHRCPIWPSISVGIPAHILSSSTFFLSFLRMPFVIRKLQSILTQSTVLHDFAYVHMLFVNRRNKFFLFYIQTVFVAVV